MATYNENIWNIHDFNLTSVSILNQPEDDFFNIIKEYHQEETCKNLKSTFTDYFNYNNDESESESECHSEDED